MPEKSIKVSLDGDLSHSDVAGVRQKLLTALSQAEEVAIDLGAVSSFDATLLQLLLSAQMSAAAAGKRLAFPGPINTDLAKFAFELGVARPEGVADEWPW